jgi:hypothetical protein
MYLARPSGLFSPAITKRSKTTTRENIQMKARTLIIMTGAILALSASVAQASVQRTLPAKQALTAHTKVVAKAVAKKQSTARPTTQPLYIYVAPSGQPASVYTYDGSMICPDGNTLDDDCGICNPAA